MSPRHCHVATQCLATFCVRLEGHTSLVHFLGLIRDASLVRACLYSSHKHRRAYRRHFHLIVGQSVPGSSVLRTTTGIAQSRLELEPVLLLHLTATEHLFARLQPAVSLAHFLVTVSNLLGRHVWSTLSVGSVFPLSLLLLMALPLDTGTYALQPVITMPSPGPTATRLHLLRSQVPDQGAQLLLSEHVTECRYYTHVVDTGGVEPPAPDGASHSTP